MNVKDVAVRTETMPVRTSLSLVELTELKDGLAERSVELDRLDDQLSEAKATFSGLMKPLKDENASTVALLRAGFREEQKTCYLVPDHDSRVMNYHTEDGEIVFSRPLKPEEWQMNILQMPATGTDQ